MVDGMRFIAVLAVVVAACCTVDAKLKEKECEVCIKVIKKVGAPLTFVCIHTWFFLRRIFAPSWCRVNITHAGAGRSALHTHR